MENIGDRYNRTEKLFKLKQYLDDSVMYDEHNNEVWTARRLMPILGYSDDKNGNGWHNFKNVIKRAITSCINSNYNAGHHFRYIPDVSEIPESSHFYVAFGVERYIVKMPNGGTRKQHRDDYILSRLGAQFVAMNADTRKEEVAFCQAYFLVMTNKMEDIIDKLNWNYRVDARNKYKEADKNLVKDIAIRGGRAKEISKIKSDGDKAFYGGLSTKEVKQINNIPDYRPLADFENPLLTSGRTFASSITSFVTNRDDLNLSDINAEHIINNENARDMLIDRGVVPETVAPVEDFRKLERRINKDNYSLLKNYDKTFLEDKKIDPFNWIDGIIDDYTK